MSLIGTWNLEVATGFFGTHPATLIFHDEGGSVEGSIDSKVGQRPLEELSVVGDSFTAKLSLEVNGKFYDGQMTGRGEGDRIEGQIKVNMIFAPTVRYTGTRVS